VAAVPGDVSPTPLKKNSKLGATSGETRRAPVGVSGMKKIFMLTKRKKHEQVSMVIVKQGKKFG
jgi:hypothetical protein